MVLFRIFAIFRISHVNYLFMQVKKLLIIILLLLSIMTPIAPTLAGPEDPNVTTVTLINPLGGDVKNPQGLTDIRVLLGNIIAGAMGIVGSVVLVVFIYGGFLWLTSAGNTERVAKGTNTMLWAAIGLFLIFGAYAILGLVLKAIGAKGGTAPVPAVITTPVVAPEVAKEKEGACVCEVTDASGAGSTQKLEVDKDGCVSKTDPNTGETFDCKWIE